MSAIAFWSGHHKVLFTASYSSLTADCKRKPSSTERANGENPGMQHQESKPATRTVCPKMTAAGSATSTAGAPTSHETSRRKYHSRHKARTHTPTTRNAAGVTNDAIMAAVSSSAQRPEPSPHDPIAHGPAMAMMHVSVPTPHSSSATR